MKIDRVDDRIVLEGTSATQVPVVRQIPGARFNTKDRTWSFPLGWATCVVARGIFGKELEVGADLAEWARHEFECRIAPAMAARRADDGDGDEKLYPFQRVGVHFLRIAGSALVGDEMGTGKTITSIALLEAEKAYPVLVVTPHGVKEDWADKFATWAPDRRVVVAGDGTATAKKAVAEVTDGNADVLIIHWAQLRSLSRLAAYGSLRLEPCSNCDPHSQRRPALCQREDKELNLIHWETVIADEVHRAKNPKADQTRALWAIGDEAERRIGLTGTPIANHAGDLWSVMRFVAPEEYPAKTAWVDRYALMEMNFFSGGFDIKGLKPETREEFDKFFLPRFIRRTKDEVLSELPPKVYERRDVYLIGKQKKAYDALNKEMVAQIEGGIITVDNKLTATLRLRQLASAYGTVVRTDGPDWDNQVELSEPSSKLDAFMEELDDLGDKPVVVFAESEKLIRLAATRLEKAGISYVVYTGTEPTEKREMGKIRFTEGRVRVFLATTGAGGEGIDGLQVADTCIFLQRPWSAVQNAQAEDRLHRIGQAGPSVTYIDLVTKGTVEERVLKALKEKAARLQDVVRDKEPV